MKILKILSCVTRLCTCCMEAHEVKTVMVREQMTYLGVRIDYDACYMYCEKGDEFYMDEHQMRENHDRIVSEYRRLERKGYSYSSRQSGAGAAEKTSGTR